MGVLPISGMTDCAVTEEHIRQYKADGVVFVRGAIPMEWIERIQPAADWCQANPGPYDGDFGNGEGGAFFCGQYMWWRCKEFHDLLVNSPITATVSRLTQSPRVQLYYDFILTKEPGAGNPTPWHQDRLYYPIGGPGAENLISTWIALDRVTLKSGAVEYIKGSHRWGKRFGPAAFNRDNRYDSLEVEAVPDIEKQRNLYDIVSWDLEPGDLVAHHVLVVHGAPANNADIRRRGLAIRWVADEMTYDPLPGTQPILRRAFEEGPAKLKPGEVIRDPAFPEFELSPQAT